MIEGEILRLFLIKKSHFAGKICIRDGAHYDVSVDFSAYRGIISTGLLLEVLEFYCDMEKVFFFPSNFMLKSRF